MTDPGCAGLLCGVYPAVVISWIMRLSGMGRKASPVEMACMGNSCDLLSLYPCPSSLQDLKRVRKQTQTRVRDFQQLYELVKNQRNKFVSLVAVAGQGIAELKEKLKMLGNEFEVIPCSTCLMSESRAAGLHVQVKVARCCLRILWPASCCLPGFSIAGNWGSHAMLDMTCAALTVLLVAPVTLQGISCRSCVARRSTSRSCWRERSQSMGRQSAAGISSVVSSTSEFFERQCRWPCTCLSSGRTLHVASYVLRPQHAGRSVKTSHLHKSTALSRDAKDL